MSAKPDSSARWVERLLILAACVVVGWFDVWTVRSSGDPWRFGQEQRDYYNLLIDGWRDGQLAMKVDVPAELLALRDPYDPGQRRAGLGLHDASFYRGKYYLYFGVGPVVTLLLPFRLLTGVDLPLAAGVLIFGYGGFLASVAVWLAVRRRYFENSSPLTAVLGVLALGFVALGPVLLRRPQVWELPIAAGYCFAMLALGAAWRALHAPRGRRHVAWLAAAGLLLGLAIASRPTYLVAAPLLLGPLVIGWRETRKIPWRALAALVLPLAAIGAGLAWHNHARFGNPLEFGQGYQFSFDYEAKVEHFSPRYARWNAWRYFFSGAQWSRYYPFIAPAELPPKPRGFGGHDDVFGLLTNLPWLWLALAAPLALRRRTAEERCLLGAWLAGAAWLFAALAALLLCFFGSLARYQVEFAPALALLAGIGALAVERESRRWRVPALSRSVRLAIAVAALASISCAALFSLRLDRLFAERNPALEREVARLLNRVPAAVERLLGREPAALELELRLPERLPVGASETLLSVGELPRPDRVFVRYLDAGRVCFGFARAAMPEVVGEPLAVTDGAVHRLRVVLGAFLPPPTHPWFAGVSGDDARRAARVLRLECDGAVQLATFRRFDPVAGARVRLGARSLGDAAYPRFTGAITAVRRPPLAPAEALAGQPSASPGASEFAFRVRLPPGRASGIEPLLVAGAPGEGDALGVEYLAGGRIRFVFDHWGSALLQSEALAVDAAEAHTLRVSCGWLQPDAGPRVERRGVLHVEWDGVVVWSPAVMGYRADPEEIVFGRNPIGGSHVGAAFAGTLAGGAVAPK